MKYFISATRILLREKQLDMLYLFKKCRVKVLANNLKKFVESSIEKAIKLPFLNIYLKVNLSNFVMLHISLYVIILNIYNVF